MSGHAVLVHAVTPEVATATMAAAGAVLSTGLATYALAQGVKKLVERQVESARAQMAAEKQRLAEWMQFQAEQLRSMEIFRQMEAALQAAEQRLAALELADVAGRATQTAEGPSAPAEQAYLSLGKTRMTPAEIQTLFNEIASIVETLPEAVRAAADSPFARLEKQQERLQSQFAGGKRVPWQEVVSFKETLARTIKEFTGQAVARREHDEAAFARLESILDDILFHRELATGPERSAIEALLSQARSLIEKREVKAGQLELIEKRLETLKKAIDARVIRKAHRTGLCESITRHLESMGYGAAAAFPEDPETPELEARLKIPGGDQIRVGITENDQVHFELIHERLEKAGMLSPSDWLDIRRQEKRWCQDFKELVRRLVAEGFSYEVASENLVPEQAIKVVVVDTADDILAASEEEEQEAAEAKKRYLS